MKKLTALLIALILLFSMTACAPKDSAASPSPSESASPSAVAEPSAEETSAPAPSAAGTSLTVTDMTGREIKLDKPAEKIVAVTAADCEILYALGAGNTVVGRGEYCDYPAEVASVPSVQSGSDTNIEQIIGLKPDVVIMSTMAQTEEQIASLENAGVKVVVSEARTIEDVYTAITMIGQVVGKNDEALTIIDTMKKTFDDIKAKVQSDGTKTVYFEVSPLEYGLWSAGTGTFMDEIGAILGLKNIFADLEDWAQVSEEQVIQRSPDYIVTTTMSFDGSQNPVDEVMGRKGWGEITAIKNGKVYNADSDAITRPGPRLAEAATALYDFVYGG
jgi:iron complex transport system substrate-binding protein